MLQVLPVFFLSTWQLVLYVLSSRTFLGVDLNPSRVPDFIFF